ncbi:YciI family protein [Ensifer sp. HO-A22]|uniref:YciI family protein n=1 Tax=Ensifer oleiphilus TaxID=2742698 RepID=A0A7Y6UP04_9HYPH|nr:YciI family protein [Ensifer oleiphilus]NVD40529.1 YciI family protein [Ensifer oleiphilus]
MYYAILAYHEEGVVESWSKEEDAALMTDLLQVNDRLVREKSLGPAARLGPTERAVTLRGNGEGIVIDGPFAETKEQLLGFYVVDFPTLEAAVAAARELRRANPTAVYEIRPISLFLPGAPLGFTEQQS